MIDLAWQVNDDYGPQRGHRQPHAVFLQDESKLVNIPEKSRDPSGSAILQGQEVRCQVW